MLPPVLLLSAEALPPLKVSPSLLICAVPCPSFPPQTGTAAWCWSVTISGSSHRCAPLAAPGSQPVGSRSPACPPSQPAASTLHHALALILATTKATAQQEARPALLGSMASEASRCCHAPTHPCPTHPPTHPPVATPCLCLSLLLQVCNEIWVVDKGTVSKWHSDIVSYKEHLRKSHAALNKRSDLG